MNVAQIIQNIKTDLENLEWISPDGGETTKFQRVYTYPEWEHGGGYPFAVILDRPETGNVELNTHIDFNTTIEIYICARADSIASEDNESAQLEEAYLRIREAWDALKVHMVKNSTLETWAGNDYSVWSRNFAVDDDEISELRLYRRVVRIGISEAINRNA